MLNFDIRAVLNHAKTIQYDAHSPILSRMSEQYLGFFQSYPHYYRVLTATAALYPDYAFLDLGTNLGGSSIAYYYGNPNATITSVDVVNIRELVPDDLLTRIEYIVDDCGTHSFGRKYQVIYLDISHNGVDEVRALENLLRQDMLRDCAVFFDDIHLNREMEEFWGNLKVNNKYDITEEAHWSGTGLIIF